MLVRLVSNASIFLPLYPIYWHKRNALNLIFQKVSSWPLGKLKMTDFFFNMAKCISRSHQGTFVKRCGLTTPISGAMNVMRFLHMWLCATSLISAFGGGHLTIAVSDR